MNIDEFQKKIDDIWYWDAQVLDIQARYLGSWIDIYFEDENPYFSKLSFLNCTNINYKTNSKLLLSKDVSKRNARQLDYWGQDIIVSKASEVLDDIELVDVKIELGMMQMELRCQDIQVTKGNFNEQRFFWMDTPYLSGERFQIKSTLEKNGRR